MVRRLQDKLPKNGPAQRRETPANRTESASRPEVSCPMFEREDWTPYRSLDGLSRRAGVTQDRLGEVVVKELVDNALDVAGDCELSISAGVVVVQDLGKGFEGSDEEIARLFSIRRPLTSSKYVRLPTRGAGQRIARRGRRRRGDRRETVRFH